MDDHAQPADARPAKTPYEPPRIIAYGTAKHLTETNPTAGATIAADGGAGTTAIYAS